MKTTAKNSRKSANSKRTNGWKKGKFETKASPTDVYEKFTKLMLDKLEQGISPWNQPWNPKGMPSNYLSKSLTMGLTFGYCLPTNMNCLFT